MNNEKLREIVSEDLKRRHGSDEVLDEDIIGFMYLAMWSVGHTNEFKSFTEWLLHLGLSDEDIMWVYTEISKIQ